MSPHPTRILITLCLASCVAAGALAQPGTLDLTFDPGTGLTGPGYGNDLHEMPDGRMIVVGAFAAYNGVPANNIIRLMPDGSIDPTFNAGSGFDVQAFQIRLQPGGKLIVAGGFTTYNGQPAPRIVRLGMDGQYDATFQAGVGLNSVLSSLVIDVEGRIYAGGNSITYDGSSGGDIIRILPDGALDPTWEIQGFDLPYYDMEICPDSNVVYAIGGDMGRLFQSGAPDATFDGDGAESTIRVLHPLPDCRMYVGGVFDYFEGEQVGRITRVNSDGTRDTTFNTGGGANFHVEEVAVMPDGKVVVAGGFNTFVGVTSWGLARMLPDGSFDAAFTVGIGQALFTTGTADKIKALPDGKLMILGQFDTFNNIPRSGICRLNGDDLNTGTPAFSAQAPLRYTMGANGDVTLLDATGVMRHVRVLDMHGRLALDLRTNADVPTGRLAPGAYLLTALDPTTGMERRAVLVRH